MVVRALWGPEREGWRLSPVRVIPSTLLGRKRIRRPGLGWAGEGEANAASGGPRSGSVSLSRSLDGWGN